ncbi:MAG: cell division protein FtsQ/DivIB [Pseudohongiellaceae bacterium]
MHKTHTQKNRKLQPRRNRGASMIARQKVEKPAFRLPRRLLFLLLGVGLLYLGGSNLNKLYRQVNEQTMEVVRIQGNVNYVSEDQIRRAMAGFMSQSLITIDLEEVRRILETEPWINKVELQREWPETMVIKVTEEVAVARWGDAELLNQKGEIFTPGEISRHFGLPYLSGPKGSERKVMTQFQKFNQLLYPLGLGIASLNLNTRDAWQLVLENGVTVSVGNNNLMAKMRRFVTFMDSFFLEKMGDIEAIDLRYANGISVSKKKLENEEIVSR